MTNKGDASIDIESLNDSGSRDFAGLHMASGSFTTVNASSDHGNLPNNEEQVTEFSSCDADISGDTQLHKACKDGNYEEVVELLQNEGVDINATDKDRRTPLHYACQVGNEEIVKLLIGKRADCCKSSNERQTPLHIACLHHHDKVVNIILSLCSEEDKKKMLDAIDFNGYTPLHVACEQECTEVVEVLLQNGANPCISSQKDPLYHRLIEPSKDENIRISAVSMNSEEIDMSDSHYLLSCHGKRESTCYRIDEKFKIGLTPLHVAAEKGFVKILKVLLKEVLKSNNDIDHTDTYQRTAFHIACKEGHVQVVELLLEHGADVNLIDCTYKGTALHIACIEGHTQIVELLLKHDGVDINHSSTDEHEHTALHIACKEGHTQIVKLLLKHDGADVTMCDKDGLNALDIAVEGEQKGAAMAIVNSNKWKDALRSYTVPSIGDNVGICNGIGRVLCCCNKKEKLDVAVANKSKAQFTTPMRRIIKKMPDVAKVVFDRCRETEKSPYDPDYKITYNYEFLEDFNLDLYNDHKKHNKWPPQSKYSSQDHCLHILANSQSSDLLKHQLTTTLLEKKWNRYGQKLYYVNLIFYFLFVILLTSFALTLQLHSLGTSHMEVIDNETSIEGHSVSQGYLSFASVCLIIYSTIMIIREAFQLVLFREEYLTSFVNYIEVPLFTLTIVFAFVCSNECYSSHSWQWQIGVIAVFLSWITLITSIRKLPVIGIYVVMFLRIFYNFLKVLILALLLILAFAIPFYMVFYDKHTPFITLWRTMIIILIMATGELDTESLLQQDSSSKMNLFENDIQYPVVAFSLLIVFVVLMPILFLNLLISLAVDDTQKIQKSADTHRKILKIEFVVYIDAFLRSLYVRLSTIIPKRLLCKCKLTDQLSEWTKRKIIVEPKQEIHPNRPKTKCVCKQMFGLFAGYVNEIKRFFKAEPQATVDDIKNQLSEEMKDLHNSVTSVSQEVKDLRSSVSQEVKDLRSSMDQLLAIVKNERPGGGGGGGVEAGGKEEEEEQN